MKKRFFLCLCLSFTPFQLNALAEEQLPDASTVIQRVLQRADETDQAAQESKYTYEKRSVSEELDDTGKPVKTTEKIYRVTPIEGVPFPRLIKIQKRDLTEEEREVQDRKEERFRRKLAEKKVRAKATERDDALTGDLVEKYDFKVLRRDRLENRAVLVLSFRPKSPHPPEKTIQDKVLNRFAGQVLVDEAESDRRRRSPSSFVGSYACRK